MEDVVLAPGDKYGSRSKALAVTPGKKYAVETKIIGISGKPFSAFFGVVLLDEYEVPLGRRVQWLNDFSGKERNYEIIFKVPEKCKSVRLLYRINKETPATSQCHYKLSALSNIVGNLKEIDLQTKEKYDVPRHFAILPVEKELTSEEENKLEQNLVWIFALPRSGTTWLGTQLLSYQTNVMDEPLIGKHLGELQNIDGDLVRYVDIYSDQPNYCFNMKYSAVWKHHLRKLILNRLYAQFKDLEHKIIIKEPNGSSFADILSECLPKSKIIIMLRDGRDVVDSKIDSLTKGGWGTKFVNSISKEEERMKIVERQSKLWLRVTEFILQAYAGHAQDRRIIIRYEDLLENTYEMLKNLYKFIDIPISDGMVKELVDSYNFANIPDSKKGAGRFYRAATPGLWKENFTDKETRSMQKIMENGLLQLGYLDNGLAPLDEKEILAVTNPASQKADDFSLLTSEQESILEKNIVWIFALPRSGTTRLGTQLLSYNTHIVGEFLIGKHLGELHESLHGYIRQIEAHYKRPDYFFNISYSLTWKHHLRKLILNRLYAQFKDLEHKIVILESNGSIAADIIAEILPDSKVVALLIDGRNFVESGVRVLSAPSEKMKQLISGSDKKREAITRQAELWTTITGFILQACESHAKQQIIIKHEELMQNP